MSSVEPSALQSLRDYLLPATLEFAARNVPYYRERWGKTWQDITGVDQLHRLPLLSKPAAIEAQELLLSGVEPLPAPVLSSGTLRDGSAVLEVRRSATELEAQKTFLQLLTRRDQNDDAGDAAQAELDADPLVAEWEQICREFSKDRVIGPDDNLFEVGVSSLTLTEIALAIEEKHPGKLDISDLFDYPTLREIAKFLQR